MSVEEMWVMKIWNETRVQLLGFFESFLSWNNMRFDNGLQYGKFIAKREPRDPTGSDSLVAF